MNRPPMSCEEFDCRIEMWTAAFDYFHWDALEAQINLSAMIWGEEYDPARGW